MNNNFLETINFRNGIITYYDFDIDPLIPFSEQKYSLKNNMLLVDYHDYAIDIGWYSKFIEAEKFIIKVIHNCDWENPLCEIESKNLVELKVNLQMMINYCEKLTSRTNMIDIDTKYSPAQFGEELKIKILQQESLEKIGAWVHCVYLDHIKEIDSDFENLLLTLEVMQYSSDIEFTREELDQVADNLIAGKKVKLQNTYRCCYD